ncbi:hypothetical protein DMENIID0001_082740 [Sergentomyia squamirostris]
MSENSGDEKKDTSDIISDYPSEKTVNLLATGLVNLYQSDVEKIQKDLNNLTSKQDKLLRQLEEERGRLDERKLKNIQEMMDSVRIYREKLLLIKKQMTSIHQRSRHLVKRSQDLQEFKEKEKQQRIIKRRQEEALIARQ